jgi:hypothetical protein
MKKILKSLLITILGLKNLFPTQLSDSEHVRSLLERLWPLSTDKKLIRLGPKGDGGYLIPDDLAGIHACFSPGVGCTSDFEKDCANLGMKVFLADKSVDRPREEHGLFHFTKKFVGAKSNDDFMTLDHWVDLSLQEKDSDLLLQIDIEGYEYEVILSASEALMRRFRIIVAEFHQLDQLWNRPFFNFASHTFDKILQTHACAHIHPNNNEGSIKKDGLEIPPVMEFTFLRRDRIGHSSYQTIFPHALDDDNISYMPSMVLPKCWYGQG